MTNKNKSNNLVSRLKSLELKIATKGGQRGRGKSNKNKGAMVVYKGSGAYSAQQANGSYMSGNNFKLFDSIWGSGKYSMSRNNLWNTGNQVPVMHSASESVRFCHREFLGDISSSIAFTTTVYPVNPGISTTFPYLSAIAQNFQEYRFKGIIFEFKSTSADALNSTNTALGTIALVAQYRADAPVPASKIELMNEMWASSGKPCDNLIMPVECAPRENPLSVQYVRTEGVSGDVKMFDLCNVVLATVGSQAAATIGELWVSYDVELFKPKLSLDSTPIQSNGFHAKLNTVSGANPMGLTQTIMFNDLTIGLGGLLTPNTIQFPAYTTGKFMIQFVYYTTAVAFTAPLWTLTGCTGVNLFQNSGQPQVDTDTDAAGLNFNVYIVNLSGVALQTVTIGVAGSFAASAVSSDLFILSVPLDMTG